MGCHSPRFSDLTHYLNLTDAVGLGFGAYQILRRYIAQGKLPAVKVGGRIEVLRSDLDALTVPKQQSTFEEVEATAERLAASASPAERRSGPSP